jgi:hypothetical protein
MSTQDSNLHIELKQADNNNSNDYSGVGKALTAVAAGAAVLTACKKENLATFELNDVPLGAESADKSKLKSNEQFIAILYTNLFQSAISTTRVFDLNQCMESVGDQDVAREVLISNFFNTPGVYLPTLEEMNADMDGFIEDTYRRFFVRNPSEAEKTWVKNFIQSNPYMTPELVFFAFALSNEYLYY